MVAITREVMNESEFNVIWRVPFTRIAYYVIHALRKAGKTGIERPDKIAKALELMKKGIKNNG